MMALVQICCGAHHSLALTKDKRVYAWGLNELGELGDKSFRNRLEPVYIPIKHGIVSISCGLNHSMALIDFGLIYIWGHNEFGQLGRERDFDYKPCCKNWVSFYPCPSNNFKNVQFIKAICGANHTLLLTKEGNVYAFGDNTNGQIGNGKVGQQFYPIRVNREVVFKDIFTSLWNDISVGVSIDNKIFVWGFSQNKKILSPRLVADSDGHNLFNVFTNCAKNKVTLMTIVVGVQTACKQIKLGSDHQLNQDQEQLFEVQIAGTDNKINLEEIVSLVPSRATDSVEENTSSSDDQSSEVSLASSSSHNESNPANLSAIFVRNSFNNPNTSDMKFNCEGDIIHCHRTILEIRNKKFWHTVGHKVGSNNEIVIKKESRGVFYAFLQFIYGLEPDINETIVADLQTMAKYFEEPQLAYLCSQYIKFFDLCNPSNAANLSNVCQLFAKAIQDKRQDLEETCVDFCRTNWKAVVRSDGFRQMDASLSKRLMCSVFTD